MSVLAKLRKEQDNTPKKMFIVVCGARLAGKSTVIGTLPGKTLMLQAAVLESGSESAKALAAELGNDLDVLTFNSVDQLVEILTELETDTEYDNVAVDSLTAITEFKSKEKDIVRVAKSNGFEAYKQIGEGSIAVIEKLKGLTYPSRVKKAKNAIITAALKIKHDKNGGIAEVDLETRGQMAVVAVTKYGEAVVTVLPAQQTEEGELPHRLITKSQDFWPGRIDGLLSHQNPGELPADLSKVLALRSGE